MTLHIQLSYSADILLTTHTNMITASNVNRQAYRQRHRVLLGMQFQNNADTSLNMEEVIEQNESNERESFEVVEPSVMSMAHTDQTIQEASLEDVPKPTNTLNNQMYPYVSSQYLSKFNHPKGIVQALDGPMTKLCVNLITGGFAVFEMTKLFGYYRFSAYQIVMIYPLIKGVKAVNNLIKNTKKDSTKNIKDNYTVKLNY